MADPFLDYDFSNPQQDAPEGMLDDMYSGMDFGECGDLFPDVNFSEDIDPGFEERLAVDYPVAEVQALTSPPQQPEVLGTYAPEPSNEIHSQYIDPQQLWNTQPTNALPNIQNFNNLGMGWPNSQQHSDGVLTHGPVFYTQPPSNQVYTQYLPMGPQFHGQQIYQQPMGTQMHGQPIMYGQPAMSTQMNSRPMIQQPIGTQTSGQRVVHQQPTNPAHQVPWLPQHQPISQTVSQRGDSSIERSRSSFVPQLIDLSRHSKQPPSPGTQTTRPRPKRPAKNHLGELLLNDKIPRKTHGKKGNDNVEPERYYGPSPKKPDNWGPRDKKGRHLFTYTDKGELAAGALFTASQMRRYLLGPQPGEKFDPPDRLPGVKYSKRKLRQGLTLWIGWPAAMANSRYPRGGESTKCRFRSCQYAQTILVGDPWVIMDERQNVDGELVDPFHNAGYMHLYCLEHHFDIIDLWHLIDIRLDCRALKRESHPYFGLEYKLPGIGTELRTWWIAEYETWAQLKPLGKRRTRSHENSLAQCLINYKLDNEPKAQTRNRQKRGGADMSKHRGNPELKRKLLAYRKHDLLDPQGFPLADAAAKLQEIENEHKAQRRAKANPQSIQQVQPVQPVHVTELAYPTANIVHTNQPILQVPYAPQAPNMVARHKRGLDETASADANIPYSFIETTSGFPILIGQETPSPKRQRLEDITPSYIVDQSTYVDQSAYIDHTRAIMHDGLGYSIDTMVATEEFPINLATEQALDKIAKELQIETQGALFGPEEVKIPDEILDIQEAETVVDNGKLISNTNEPVNAGPSPAFPESNSSGNSDLDSFFSKPEGHQTPETPPSPSATPKEGESPCLPPEPSKLTDDINK
ncbi:hypothetical protein E0Z10_g7237 [Xylaria hypoxylon]|uniref:Uncharacterized protein n=1 Tax=Xylaria hypoxylon TaxID=37992 RepID=A0A4Z0YEF2_9PEZI|nr:hypothetical protein E0Z10_g7237 [Xylaria hypoxylon]